MSFDIIRYTNEHETTWDSWCNTAGNATFLHTRKFLSYHQERFEDASVLIFESDRLAGILPAARAVYDASVIISHPGATYGGIVHQGWLSGEKMIEALAHLKRHYRQYGYTSLLYKPLPYVYALLPSQDDLYALFRHGAKRVRCDLSSTIDLSSRRAASERRRRGIKKALKSVVLTSDHALLSGLWRVLLENLKRKHDASPVHSLAELAILIERFPKNIQIRCAIMDNRVEAGIVVFCSNNVWHAQYIASSETGYVVCALDAVFESAIEDARRAGVRYFDFGTSNEESGLILNDGLYRFKSEFGGGGVAHEYYELVL